MKTDLSPMRNVPGAWRSDGDGSRKTSEWQPSLTSIRLQPIFREDGEVLEYALIANPMDPSSTGIAGSDLWTTIAFLLRHSEDLRLSIQWLDNHTSEHRSYL
jgi:hypothetical protein